MKKNILITAVGGRSVGSGILHSLLRSSKEVSDRWNIIAADADSFAWGLYKVQHRILLPLAKEENYIQSIKDAIEKYNLDAIIPGSEIETQILTQNRNLFKIPIIANEFELMPYMMDKFYCLSKIKEFELPTIPTFKISEADKVINQYNFPLIIKPTVGTGGSKGVVICEDIKKFKSIEKEIIGKENYCIQPLIGDEEEEYTVGVLSDKKGEIIDSIVMKRKLIGLSLLDSKFINNKKVSISTGYSQGYFIKNAKIQTFCEDLARKIGSKGPLNIQLRILDNKIYVFEVHPRFSGTSTMRADVGFNEVDILLRNFLFDEKFERIKYQYDVAVIRAFEHVIVPIKEML